MLIGLRHDGYDGDPVRAKAAQILARMLTGDHADQVAKWLGWQLHDSRQAMSPSDLEKKSTDDPDT